jgi:penicillin-binding protein 1A
MAEAKSRFRGCVWRIVKWTGLVSFFLLLVALAAAVALAWAYREYVVNEPGPHLERSFIMGVIEQDSPVYYRDGKQRVGVFFEDEHRHYVAYETLPQPYVMALVAAEDGAYFSHPGVNIRGIARAMRDNSKAGRVVAGGSTLTQQTAKNLFYRPDRSIKSKGVELLNALRLEAHFEKPDILEFYANQFHVTGNGRGIGIAAKHFFDKEVDDLSLVECAFVAGLVKAPSYYDPFLGDGDRRARSAERAHDRTRYVLRRLAEERAENLVPLGADDDALAEVRRIQYEAGQLLATDFVLPFRRGTFRYESSAVLDEVARRLAEPPFDTVLREAGIDDPASAGLEVITTLDADAQREAVYGLWHHLTEVGAWLEAPSARDFVRADARGPRFDPSRPPLRHTFRIARVAEKRTEPKKHLLLDLGGHECVADRSAVERAALAVARGRTKNRYTKVGTADVDALADAFAVDDVLFVSVRESGETAICDLERRPELQGATVVLEDGQLRAMVGGNDNRNFNRATALRQMGSTWKPLIFHAALQLNWSPDDDLDNRRGVFPFSTTFYYPRPDHEPAPVVSMSWAGVNSENLASIWLLYHLTDRLDTRSVSGLADALGLAREPDEDEKAYRTRIQKAGVLPTPRRIQESLFMKARHEVWASGNHHEQDALEVASLHYGWGFNGERKRVGRLDARTRTRAERALDGSWVSMSKWLVPCERQYEHLVESMRSDAEIDDSAMPDLSVLVDGDRIRVACAALPTGYVSPSEGLSDLRAQPPEQEVPATEPLQEIPTGKGLKKWLKQRLEEGPDLPQAKTEVTQTGPKLDALPDVLVDDRLHMQTLMALGDALRREQLTRDLLGPDAPGLYDPDILYWHQDFRVLLSMRYVNALAREFGVRTEIKNVLAMPLGASEITIEETAMMYSGITTGQRYAFPGTTFGRDMPEPPAPSLLISQIRDVDGNVIYQVKPELVEVTRREVGDLTADILFNVVEFGTGRRASSAAMHGATPVPLGGKTGTTNEFRNAAFVGIAPAWTGTGYQVDDGFVVATYVGYDDNRPLSSGRTRLAGSSGALPAWIGAVRGLAEVGLLGDPSDTPGDQRRTLVSGHLLRVPVDEVGRPLSVELTATEPVGVERTVLVRPPEIPDVQDVAIETTDRPARIAPKTTAPPRPRDREGASSIWD